MSYWLQPLVWVQLELELELEQKALVPAQELLPQGLVQLLQGRALELLWFR